MDVLLPVVISRDVILHHPFFRISLLTVLSEFSDTFSARCPFCFDGEILLYHSETQCFLGLISHMKIHNACVQTSKKNAEVKVDEQAKVNQAEAVTYCSHKRAVNYKMNANRHQILYISERVFDDSALLFIFSLYLLSFICS